MTDDEFEVLVGLSLEALEVVVEYDWSTRAGVLDWSCRQTVEHVIDCIFSYAIQIGARAQFGYIPLQELHALPGADSRDLMAGLRGVAAAFLGVVRDAPVDATATDGVVQLDLSDWSARAAYELVIHTHDVLSGFGGTFNPPLALCHSILASDALWMLDREQVSTEIDPWLALLSGSGRPVIANT